MNFMRNLQEDFEDNRDNLTGQEWFCRRIHLVAQLIVDDEVQCCLMTLSKLSFAHNYTALPI